MGIPEKIDGIIFDLDGTLWDSTEGILKSWARTLAHYPQIDRVITKADTDATFGMTVEQIGEAFFPNETEEMRKQIADTCGEEQNKYLAEFGGKLFGGGHEVLSRLKEHFGLYIVSNCQDGYIEGFYSGNGTAGYFKDKECRGATGLSKGENIKLVVERNRLHSAVYVGDTQFDADAAAEAGIPFIYAKYGFGDVKAFDMVPDSFNDLLGLIERAMV